MLPDSSAKGFQVNLPELFPPPQKITRNQEPHQNNQKHTKDKSETLIPETSRIGPKRLHERGMFMDVLEFVHQRLAASSLA